MSVHNILRRSIAARQSVAGFTLIEALVSLGVLLVFTSGVYGGIQLVSQVVYQSRLRIVQSAILSEQIEFIRNLSFFDVGIVNGSPAGVLTRTVTTTRNGIDFVITRTVRNIDDPFDGTIDAAPVVPPNGMVFVCHNGSTLMINVHGLAGHLGHGDTQGPCDGDPEAGNIDYAPADYKFVEVSIICTNCRQRTPLSLNTLVGPKFLEGNPEHGALFVQVIDASGRPVPGATVHITSTSTNPVYNFEDTTGSDGMLRIVDLAAGQNAYHIVVSKDGYTTDMTTTSVANPIKPPASVVSQSVTSRTFTIDRVSTMQVQVMNIQCIPMNTIGVAISGQRVISMNPDIYMVDRVVMTNTSGSTVQSNLPWDNYTIIPIGYDLIGSIPMLPLIVSPGETRNLQLLVGPNTAQSLLVHVQDAASGDPISGAIVELSRGQNIQSIVTGVGTIRQVSWSGGAGQSMYTNVQRYAADNGNISAGDDITLIDVAASYPNTGWLESSTFDLGGPTNFVSLEWSPLIQPIVTGTSSVRMQFASSNTSTPVTWNFLGPDETANTYYTDINRQIAAVHNGNRYVRYRLVLSTDTSTVTPVVSDIAFSYVSACTPPGQAYFGNLEQEVYTITVSADGYAPYSSDITLNSDVRLIVSLTNE
jgi:type II secretory pathway pseudopilin PulG